MSNGGETNHKSVWQLSTDTTVNMLSKIRGVVVSITFLYCVSALSEFRHRNWLIRLQCNGASIAPES